MMSIKVSFLLKFYFFVILITYTVYGSDFDDNQLVALEDDENNEENDLNQGNFNFKSA